MKKIIVSLSILIIFIGGAFLIYILANQTPTFMVAQPEYTEGSDVSAYDLLTDSVANISDDRTPVEDLQITMYKNDILIENTQDEQINTTDTSKDVYTVVIEDNLGAKAKETIAYSVK